MSICIHPSTRPPETKLHFGRGLLQTSLLSSLCRALRPIVVADKAVARQFNLEAPVLEVESQHAKTRRFKERIEDELLQKGYGRDTVLIAYGGGSVTDAVGFVAATYLRGIAWIAVPTTILGMVDASIGGKTAIDTQWVKNGIGAIHHPKAVVVDPQIARPITDLDFAEILKIALVSNEALWSQVITVGLSDEVLLGAIRAKIAIIEQDPTEMGIRRVVNFGHTVAHALELVSEYEMSHAEAVIVGTAAESYLSYRLGFLPRKDWEQIETYYNRFFVTLPKQYERSHFIHAMRHDKKNESGKIRFVLIETIGKALPFDGQYCTSVSEPQIEEMSQWLEQRFTRRN